MKDPIAALESENEQLKNLLDECAHHMEENDCRDCYRQKGACGTDCPVGELLSKIKMELEK